VKRENGCGGCDDIGDGGYCDDAEYDDSLMVVLTVMKVVTVIIVLAVIAVLVVSVMGVQKLRNVWK